MQESKIRIINSYLNTVLSCNSEKLQSTDSANWSSGKTLNFMFEAFFF